MKSLAFVVVIDWLAGDPEKPLDWAFPSNGKIVLAPDIPKATAAAGDVVLVLVMVMPVEVLDKLTAYQVSILTW